MLTGVIVIHATVKNDTASTQQIEMVLLHDDDIQHAGQWGKGNAYMSALQFTQ